MGAPEERDFAGYRIVRPLELGELASVWEAEDTESGDPVAIETLAGDGARDDDVREWFTEAWEMVAELDHPGLVTVLEVGDDDGVPFAVRAPASEMSLAGLLRERGPLEPGDAVAILAEVGDALEAAHEAGVVHGTLDPSCVIFEGEDEPRAHLTGFGRTEGNRREDVRELGGLLAAMLAGGDDSGDGDDADADDGDERDEARAALGEVVATATDDGYRTAPELIRAAEAAVSGDDPDAGDDSPAVTESPGRGLVLALVAVAAVVLIIVIASGGDDDSTPASTSANASTSTSAAEAPTTSSAPPVPIGVRGFPVGVATSDDDVYAVTRDGASLDGFDQASGERVAGPIDLGGPADDLTIVGGVAWATLPDDGLLARLDLAVGDAPAVTSTAAGAEPRSLVAALDSIWVVDEGSGKLLQFPLELTGDTKPETIALDAKEPRGIASGLGSLWVSDASGKVLRIDPEDSSKQEPFDVGGDPGNLLVVDDQVWVANEDKGTVTELDPASGESRPIDVGGSPRDLAADSKQLWVANATGSVTSIELNSDGISQIDLSGAGGSPQAIAVGQQVWTTTGSGNMLIAVAPGE